MATGDVYTHGDTGPSWGATADVIGADGPVLTDQSGQPAWVAASAAQAGPYDVYTQVASTDPGSQQGGWGALPSTASCLSSTPTLRLVAGGIDTMDEVQIDGPLGTNTCETVMQMAWGPDGLIYLAGVGQPFPYVRTFDPLTGEVVTTPFFPVNFGRDALKGIAVAASGNIYMISQGSDDSNTTALCMVPAGATDNSETVALHYFTDFSGSASLMRHLGVVTNPDGKEFVILMHESFSQVMYFDVEAGTLHQYMESYVGAPQPDDASPDMGEGVAGDAGVLGEQLRGLYVSPSREVVTGSSYNEVIRSASIVFVDDGDGGTVPQANNLHSVTNHALNAPQSGYGGDGAAAYTSGDYGPQFNALSVVAVDGCGQYYGLDIGNNVVRQVDHDGILHTIAGDGQPFDGPDPVPATADPVLATTVRLYLDFTSLGGAVLPDPAGGVYFANYNAIMKLEG